MKTHLCLVSAQPMPNYLGARIFKPDKIIWIYTAAYERVMDNLEKALGARQEIEFERHQVDPYDITKTIETVDSLLDAHYGEQLSLNSTCGTKIMSIGAVEACRKRSVPIFYVDTDQEKIIYPLEEKSEILDYKMEIAEYLLLHGQKMADDQTDEKEIKEREQLTSFIAKNILRLNQFLLDLRRIDKKEDFSISYEKRGLFFKVSYYAGIGNLIVRFGSGGKTQKITIPQNRVNYLLGGNWLEELIYQKCKKRRYDDVKINVKLNYLFPDISSRPNIKNEIDVVVCHRCKLYLISCKVGKFEHNDLFALTAMRELTGGLFGKNYFVTINEPDELFVQRCRDLHVNLVRADQLHGFCPVDRD